MYIYHILTNVKHRWGGTGCFYPMLSELSWNSTPNVCWVKNEDGLVFGSSVWRPPLHISVVCCNSVTCVTTVTSVTNITAVSRGSHACSVTFRVGLPWRKRRASLLQFLEQINSEFTLSTLICLLLAFPVNWREIFFCVYLYIYTYFEWWTWQLRRVLVAANIKLG